MSDPKDFVAGIDSDQRRSPTRVVFVTRRTSAQVKVTQEDQVQTFPEVLFRAAARHRVARHRAGPLLAVLQCAAGGHRRPDAHAQPGQSALVLPGPAGTAALFPAGGCRRAGANPAYRLPDCYSLLQRKHRSQRPLSERPHQANAVVLPHGPGYADLSSGIPCLRRRRSHRDRGVGHDRGRLQHARFAFAPAPLPGIETPGLLDHDVVFL